MAVVVVTAVLLVKAMNLVEDVIMLGIVAVPALYVLGWLFYAW
jgi:hypothetical protein